jgi:hypothetical protein
MTQAERVDQLAILNQAHPVLACRTRDCPACRHYYQVLLTPDPPGGS